MVRAYRHPGRNLTEMLEYMAIARADGIDVSKAFERLLDKIAAANCRAD